MTTGSARRGYRSLLQAVVNVYNERHDLPPFKLKAIPFDNQRIRFLSHADRDRLIASYSAHVQPIVTMFAFQGPRRRRRYNSRGARAVWTWRAARSTSRATRPATLERWRSIPVSMRCCAHSGPSVESRRRGMCSSTGWAEPYTDTRNLKVQGGNPLQTAHENACRRAGIADFI